MKRSELKKLLKPIVEECIKEALFEQGMLSGIISEVVQGLGAPNQVIKQKQPPEQPQPLNDVRDHLRETQQKMLDSIGREAYGGVNIFEGTEPISTAGDPGMSDSPSGPLSGVSPGDPGVDISNIVNLAGNNWGKLAGN